MQARPRDLWAGLAAALLPVCTILLLVWPNLRGTFGLGSETMFDVTDPLFGDYRAPSPRAHDDDSPVQYDWPRDRRLRERVRQGHFDLWNPLPGNGVPLPSDPGGIFSPLRLVLYAAPLSPYTAYVLFRVMRLLVAALGAYLLGRSISLSRPASVVVGVAFGLSGGMLSQLPFATPQAVCWLPWICWAQVRIARWRTIPSIVPHALCTAAAMVGGHQPIVVAMILGGLIHAAGMIAVRTSSGARRRVAVLMAAGYSLGALLAAPAALAAWELVANGHSYKVGALASWFRETALVLNRGLLFPGAVFPYTVDTLRDHIAYYPYVLHFSCGVLTYLLAALAIAWRRWRLEWLLVILFGIALCFQPPGFKWFGEVPLFKDILPRYTWALCVLPVCVAAGFGVDALFRVVGDVHGAPFVPRGRRPTLTAGLAVAVSVLALLAAFSAGMMAVFQPEVAAVFAKLLKESWSSRLNAAVPLASAVVVLIVAVVLFRARSRWGLWLIAFAACGDLSAIARPLLRDPPSRAIRNPPLAETAELAAEIAKQHTRVAGRSSVTIGWGGWREMRSISPLAPLRYARFLEAAAGAIDWTTFELPNDRSALADLAGAGYLIVPRRDQANLENDPAVARVGDIQDATVYRNDGALPRARVVHRTIIVPSVDEAVAQLASLTAGQAHVAGTKLASAAILEPVRGAGAPRALEGGPPSAAEFLVDDPDEVVLKVDSPEPGYVVLADTNYPGWLAAVDGSDQPIYPANVGFRAVYVDTGRHNVAFRYRPTTFSVGLACTIIGILACAGIGMGEAVRRSRLPPHSRSGTWRGRRCSGASIP